jgi:predicted TIM-barrel fold metal-dependent hydrolase
MSLPFTNIHTHVFTSDCAPDRFLRILPVKFVRWFPGLIKGAIDTKAGRNVIHGLYQLLSSKDSNKRGEVDKYVSFLKVGTSTTQLDVFRTALAAGKTFDSSLRIVGLTMNMDHMDSQPSRKQISFATQLDQVKDVKRYYPTNFFPFLGIDPRQGSGMELVKWARPYFESGVATNEGKVYPYFSGIKLYPALGFFPFDPRLEELYRYAEANNLPVMTHCTRVGSQYIGNQIESLIPDSPAMIGIPGNANILAAKTSIELRINEYKKRGWIKNSKIGDNDLACDLFGHPENYIPILEKFPNLKICLAHMGGSNEVVKSMDSKSKLDQIRQVDPASWFEHIERMMKQYPNLYTDVSYTLSDFDNSKIAVLQKTITFLNTPDGQGKQLGDRVLFGTDFFMTEQERREPELYAITQKNIPAWWDVIGRTNTQKYLMQPI